MSLGNVVCDVQDGVGAVTDGVLDVRGGCPLEEVTGFVLVLEVDSSYPLGADCPEIRDV